MAKEKRADDRDAAEVMGIGSGRHVRFLCFFAGCWFLAVFGSIGDRAWFGRVAAGAAEAASSAADPAPADSIFMPAERSTILLLERTQQLLKDDRYAEAVQCLDRILSGKEDFFYKPDAETSVHQSIKSEAQRRLGMLGPGGRQSYELQFGAFARSTLESAVETGNLSMIGEVARRFFHTEAGHDANFLLGLHHLDHGRPLVAALTLRRLRDESTNPERFEPALSLAMARSWLDAGMAEDAREALESLRDRYEGRSVTIGGRDVPLFSTGEDSVEWLLTSLGPGHSDVLAKPSDWTMRGGSPQRVSVCEGGRPLLNSRWYVRATDHPAVEEILDQLRQQQEDREMPLLSGLCPLVVGNVVLMRTATNLLAVDFKTGKRLWEVPAPDPLEAALNPPPDGYVSPQPNLESGLRLRLWGDGTFGTLASDGRLVFAIEDLPLPTATIYSRSLLAAGNGGTSSGSPMTSNRLAAFEIGSEGKLRWELGGADSEHPLPLAGTFFLGPPLPLLGDLYVLAEIGGEIRLLALKADNGELLWQQQLAVVEQGVFYDLLRRVSGVSPSYGDGILICPTSHHSIVALDLTTRSLLWGYNYGDLERGDQRATNLFGAGLHRTGNPEDRWTDWVAVIADGRVLTTPADSNQLHCLSLRDGRLLWRVPREDGLFVAAVEEGKVVVASRTGLTALNLENGESAWKTTLASCAPGSEPSGRGFSDGEVYYLPLTKGKLMTVRLATGQVEQVVRSRDGRTLGNLVSHGGKVISQRADGVESYDQLEALRVEVDGILARQPDDAPALAVRGEILWDEGKLDDAVECLRKSFQLSGSDHARSLLRDVMFDGLDREFARYQAFRDEIGALLETPDEHVTLHRLMAVGWEKGGEYHRTLAEYRALVDLDAQQTGFVEIDEDYLVREDRWIQARLRNLYQSAPEDVRAELLRWSKEALQAGQLAGNGDGRRVLRYFDGLPGSREYKTAWIERLVEAGRLSEAELAMIGDVEASEGEARGHLLARWTRMLLDAERVSDAASLLTEIETRWGDVPFGEGRNGRQWAVEFADQQDAIRQARVPAKWPRGYVKTAVTETEQGSIALGYGRGFVPFQGGKGRFFDDLVIEHQPQHIVARNGIGQIKWQFPIRDIMELEQLAFSRALMRIDACGHLLILSLGDQVIALDTLRTKDDGTPTVAWRESIDGADRGTLRLDLLQPRVGNAPGWIDGTGAIGPLGYSFGAGFAIGESLVCIKRSRACAALDAATGQTLWKRDGISGQSMIFGDDHYLLVVARQSTEARVFRASDGAELESRTIPPEEQRLMTDGRRIVCWEPHGPEAHLKMIDPLKSGPESVVWGPYPFALDAKQQVVEGEAIAVCSPEGKFQLIRLADGQLIVDSQLELEQPLTDIVVLRGDGQSIVIANNSLSRRDPKRHISQVTTLRSRPIGSAKVYAFDDQGNSLWEKPTAVEDQFLPLVQPRDVPCLTFACAVHDMTPGRAQQAKTEIVCLDTRSGTIVVHQEFTHGGNALEIAAMPDESRVEIRMPQETLCLMFTDEPVPEQGYSKAAEVPSNPLKAILRAMLKGAAVRGESETARRSSPKPSDGEGDRGTSKAGNEQGGEAKEGEPVPADGAPAALHGSAERPRQIIPPPLPDPAIRDRIPPAGPTPPR